MCSICPKYRNYGVEETTWTLCVDLLYSSKISYAILQKPSVNCVQTAVQGVKHHSQCNNEKRHEVRANQECENASENTKNTLNKNQHNFNCRKLPRYWCWIAFGNELLVCRRFGRSNCEKRCCKHGENNLTCARINNEILLKILLCLYQTTKSCNDTIIVAVKSWTIIFRLSKRTWDEYITVRQHSN